MDNRCTTLLDKLVSLVTKDKIEEVTSIVHMLNKLNGLKYSIDNSAPIENLYKKIAYELQVEFNIFNFNIVYTTKEEIKLLYDFGEPEVYHYSFSYDIDKESKITVNIDSADIGEFKQISLNSYFDDILQILYLHYILQNSQIAMVDPLTKLTTRIGFQEEIKTLIPLAFREGMNIGALLINIDRFRAVNDEHGNEFGDEFLKLYADIIKKSVRNSDMAVRFSGGEFLVLLVNVGSEEKTLEIADNIREKLADAYLKSPNGDKFKKTVCIGVSMFPEDSDDINVILKNTEIALSDAKDSGRNQVLRFKASQESVIELF